MEKVVEHLWWYDAFDVDERSPPIWNAGRPVKILLPGMFPFNPLVMIEAAIMFNLSYIMTVQINYSLYLSYKFLS